MVCPASLEGDAIFAPRELTGFEVVTSGTFASEWCGMPSHWEVV
jgi:hypothetical protein